MIRVLNDVLTLVGCFVIIYGVFWMLRRWPYFKLAWVELFKQSPGHWVIYELMVAVILAMFVLPIRSDFWRNLGWTLVMGLLLVPTVVACWMTQVVWRDDHPKKRHHKKLRK